MNRGQLFVFSAPSGTGKTTLIRGLLADELKGHGGLAFSVSHTSREPRAGEIDGRDYHFVDRASFEQMIEEDRFLEWAEVYGDYKGTSLDEVEPRLEEGLDVILDIDVQGAERVMSRCSDAISIFILPPSREEMERRIRGRGLDQPAQIVRRLSLSRWEIERYSLYDYAIINDHLGRAGEALAAIILAQRHRRSRMEARIREILDGFPGQTGAPGQESNAT